MRAVDAILFDPVGALAEFPPAPFRTVSVSIFSQPPSAGVNGSLAYWHLVDLIWIFLFPLLYLVYRSHREAGAADWDAYISFRDPKEAKRWQGKKIPMEILYEAYMAEKVDFKQDLFEVLLHRNQLFRFAFTWGDVKFYFREFLGQNVTHSKKSDRADIAHVYDRGNDFYNWFLGPSMTYSCGFWPSADSTLETAQASKYELVCGKLGLEPGMRLLVAI